MTDTTTPRTLTPAERQAIRERYGESNAPICKEHGTRLEIGLVGDGVVEYACLIGREDNYRHYWATFVRVPISDSRVIALLEALDAADARLERWRRVVEAAIAYNRSGYENDGSAGNELADAVDALLASGDAAVSDG